jgi:hypothetical protein
MRNLFMLTALLLGFSWQLFNPAVAATAESRLSALTGSTVSRDQPVEAIAAQIIKRFPIGTSAKTIVESCQQTFGKTDKQIYLDAGKEAIFVRIHYDTKSFGLVKTSYDVVFLLDGKRALKDVKVNRHLTGL